MAEENGLTIDEAEFEAEKEKSKEKSKGTKAKDSGEIISLNIHALGELEQKLKVKVTDDQYKYSSDNIEATVLALYQKETFVNSITSESQARFGILLDKTNFYAEQGGQQYDTGSITIDGKADFAVEDVQIFGGYVLHIGYLKYGSLSVSDKVVCSFDEV
jgi:alanyl-tRNA synthetase